MEENNGYFNYFQQSLKIICVYSTWNYIKIMSIAVAVVNSVKLEILKKVSLAFCIDYSLMIVITIPSHGY